MGSVIEALADKVFWLIVLAAGLGLAGQSPWVIAWCKRRSNTPSQKRLICLVAPE
jgi:hypothetical protein